MTETKNTLNTKQQEASDAFFEFLFSPAKEMGITGPGGVGKTHLMSHMIDEILPHYFDTCKMMGITPAFNEVVMTATTNKAGEVVAVATNRPVSTIHSFMNLKVTENRLNGKTSITKTATWKIHENKIIFIDECSMIDSVLYEHIIDGTQNCKIIYIGDHCQLAPVTESLSPVFRRNIPFYELTEPMRTNIPELHALNNQLRDTVETGEFKPIKIIPGIIDYLEDDELAALITDKFTEQTLDGRILAYTNKRVIQYNDHIRELRSLPDEYVEGEFLVNNSAVRLKNYMLSVEEEVQIIALSSTTTTIDFADDLKMDIREATITSRVGGTFSGVKLPVDRNHYSNLVDYFAKKKNWAPFFDLKNNYPDLRPRDAGTFYKAQGSTYDYVILDLANLSECKNPNQAARQLYVGGSRARTRVYLYGQLAEKYGGLIQ